MSNKLRIGLVLPDVLGTYGDDGNALVLRQRARMRDIDAEIVCITLSDPVPDDLNVYTIGGGEDTAQILAAEHLIADGGLAHAAAAERPILAICAGLQVLGTSFNASGREVAGVGLIDATTAPMAKRAIGELAARPSRAAKRLGLTEPLTGFENHLGATILGPEAEPLGAVIRGTGNADEHAVQAGHSVGGGRSGHSVDGGHGADTRVEHGAGADFGVAGDAGGPGGAGADDSTSTDAAASGNAAASGGSASSTGSTGSDKPLNSGDSVGDGASSSSTDADEQSSGQPTGRSTASSASSAGRKLTGIDGVIQGSVIATYMHGPCLARNPQLADLLLAQALGVEPSELEPLEIPEIDRLRMERLAR